MQRPAPGSTLFPYTTLFRSRQRAACRANGAERDERQGREQARSEEHTSELQSHHDLVCRLLLEKNNHLAKQIAPDLRHTRGSVQVGELSVPNPNIDGETDEQ